MAFNYFPLTYDQEDALAVAEECVLITADAKFQSAVAMTPLAGHIQWVEEEL